MNRQIVKLFGFTVVLFAVLIGFTSYWAVFDAKALKDKDANKRPLLEQQQIKRGRILAADGTVIARSVAKGQRRRPALRAPLPGGLALRPPDRLQLRARRATPSSSSSTTTSWSATNRNSARSSTSCAARSRKATTSSPTSTREAQRIALEGLRGRTGFGAVVAIEPSTGKVKVLASNAPYDPNRVPYELTKLNLNEARSAAGRPRHPVPLPARLDLQGGDRGGGARQRHDHPGNADRRPRLARRPGPAARKRLRHLLLRADPRRRPDQLGQHLVRPGRRKGRRGHPVRIHGQIRLQHEAGDRPALRTS